MDETLRDVQPRCCIDRLRAPGQVHLADEGISVCDAGRHTTSVRIGDRSHPSFRVYDLRHTFGSLLLSMNAALVYVSQQMGHKSPATPLVQDQGGSSAALFQREYGTP